ncbi:hypothetical protein RJ639_010085 [Escallonia herrerae]|uniref:Retrovirus-related Pol polyprotein from transposon TNT 1-94 n=1 Tax=Escallonia herrerae TaxID=1293975 RepID=A0AA88VSY1_9ASTE|nr:hypothetical protein RJ639_010085 [Escallonia herrerae]
MKMRDVLIEQGLLKALKGKQGLPDTMSADEKEDKLERAHSALLLCLADNMLRKVSQETIAAGLWLKLESLYMRKSLKNLIYLKQRLYTPWIKEDTSVVYHRSSDANGRVVRYVDSDYTGDLDRRRSLTGYVFTFSSCVISWKATLQTIVVLSTTEAEHIAATEAVQELIWLKGLVAMGSEMSNRYWEAELPPHFDRSTIEKFIRAKKRNGNATKPVPIVSGKGSSCDKSIGGGAKIGIPKNARKYSLEEEILSKHMSEVSRPVARSRGFPTLSRIGQPEKLCKSAVQQLEQGEEDQTKNQEGLESTKKTVSKECGNKTANG